MGPPDSVDYFANARLTPTGQRGPVAPTGEWPDFCFMSPLRAVEAIRRRSRYPPPQAVEG